MNDECQLSSLTANDLRLEDEIYETLTLHNSYFREE